MDRKGLGVSARRGMMTTPRIHSFFPKLSLASVHKYLRIRDLCKELAFGSQHAGGECRSSYNSFEFNVLCRQFLESCAFNLNSRLWVDPTPLVLHRTLVRSNIPVASGILRYGFGI